jgi:hypothetical protein
MLDHFIDDLFGYFDLVECIFLCVCCLRRRSALYFGAPGGGAVSASALALQFGVSGGGNTSAARGIGIQHGRCAVCNAKICNHCWRCSKFQTDVKTYFSSMHG